MPKVGKITNPKMQTSAGPMRRPHKENDSSSYVLTSREIAEYRRKNKAAKKK